MARFPEETARTVLMEAGEKWSNLKAGCNLVVVAAGRLGVFKSEGGGVGQEITKQGEEFRASRPKAQIAIYQRLQDKDAKWKKAVVAANKGSLDGIRTSR